MTWWSVYCHFVRFARPATTSTMEGKITFGYPNRTTAVTAVEVIKAQNSAAIFSVRPICFYKWAFLSLLGFLSDRARDRRTQARATFSSISLVARVMGDESHCMQYRIGWLIWFDPVASLKSWDIFNVRTGSSCTVVCMFFRRGQEKKVTLHRRWIAEVFGLKSCSSMSVSFERQHFKLVLVLCKQSASF